VPTALLHPHPGRRVGGCWTWRGEPAVFVPMSSSGIAGQLFVSYDTVKSRARHIYRKLGVSSREQAVSQVRDVTRADLGLARIRRECGAPRAKGIPASSRGHPG
jgi:Bacterial regulatory proteins, luxR family